MQAMHALPVEGEMCRTMYMGHSQRGVWSVFAWMMKNDINRNSLLFTYKTGFALEQAAAYQVLQAHRNIEWVNCWEKRRGFNTSVHKLKTYFLSVAFA